jgi:dipeptidyl aminopeptidase/acylaminoacyl peptidase
MEAEFGVAQWVFGMTTFGFQPDGAIIARYTRGGKWCVARIEPASGKHRTLELPYSTVSSIDVAGPPSGGPDVPPGSQQRLAYAIAGSPTEPEALVEIDLSSGKTRMIRRSSTIVPDPGYTSVPETIEFPTGAGKVAHAFYYPPANRDFGGRDGEAPPLLVLIHGGPTSATAGQFRPTPGASRT